MAIDLATAGEVVVAGGSVAYVQATVAQLVRVLGGRIAAAEDEPADDDDEDEDEDEDTPISIDWSQLSHTFTIVLRCDRAVSRGQLDDLARGHDGRYTIAFARPSRDYLRVTFDGPDGLAAIAQRVITALHEGHAAFPIDIET